MRPSRDPATVWAFAPGHISGIFSPELTARDPRARGSVGAGIVLELGVHARARLRSERPHRVIVRSDAKTPVPISEEVATRLFADTPGRLEVDLRHELPIGQGFGMSAAGALSTGIAVAELLGRPFSDAVTTAHLADLFSGGGLGGVSAILGGGIEFRRRAGVPPFGEVVHQPFPYRLILTVVGPPLASPRLLNDPRFLERVRRAASAGLRVLSRGLSPPRFFDAAHRFGRALPLGDPVIARRLTELRRRGAHAGQAMFGNAIWIVPTDGRTREASIDFLRGRRLPALEISAAHEGARFFRDPIG